MSVRFAVRGAALVLVLASCSVHVVAAPVRLSPTPDRTTSRACPTNELRLRVRPLPSNAGAQQLTADVELTNASAHTCALRGYPTVRFRGRSARNHDPLRHQTDDVRTVSLAPGRRAHSTLTYLIDVGAECGGRAPFRPATILVTAPGTDTPIGFPWRGRSVDDCHGGATHPGTYIGALHIARSQ